MAIVRDGMLPTLIVHLAENCPNPSFRGVDLESELSGEIRTLEYREAAQLLLQLLKRGVTLMGPLYLVRGCTLGEVC